MIIFGKCTKSVCLAKINEQCCSFPLNAAEWIAARTTGMVQEKKEVALKLWLFEFFPQTFSYKWCKSACNAFVGAFRYMQTHTHTHSFMSHPLRRLFSDTCSVHTTRHVRPFTHKSPSHPQQALLAFCSPPPHRLSPYLPPSLPWCFPPAGRARLAWRFSMGRCWCIVELKQPCRSIM